MPFEWEGKAMRDVGGRANIVRPARWWPNEAEGGHSETVVDDGKDARRANLEALYRDNFQKVYNYAYYRLLDPAQAEDLTSAVFIKAVENFDRYDPSKAKFSTWIMSIAHNALIDYYRTRRVNATLDDLGAYEPACEDNYPALDDHAKEVARLLSFISEEDREIVYLKYYEDKRNIEIAEMLDMNPSTVATRLKRALATMRAHTDERP